MSGEYVAQVIEPVAERPGELGMPASHQVPFDRHCLAERGLGLGDLADSVVNGVEQFCFDLGVIFQNHSDLRRGPVEDIA